MTIPTVPAPSYEPPVPAVKKKLGRGALIAIIAGGLVLLLAFGAAAVLLVRSFFGSGESATASAVAFPASTLYWTEVAIQPSGQQMTEALRFINELDSLRDAIEDSDIEIDLDDSGTNIDVRKALWDFVVEGDDSSIDTKLDYEDDIAPWIGNRISFGMVPTDDLENGEQPPVFVAIEARDTEAGIDAIEDLLDDLDVDAEVDAKNGYVLVATGDIDLDDIYDDGTLDGSKAFQQSAANAGDQGVASVFVDLGSLYALINEATTGDYGDIGYWEDYVVENPWQFSADSDAYEDYEDCSAFDSPENVGDEFYEDYECNYYYEYNGEYYEYYSDFEDAWIEDNKEELAQEKLDEYGDAAEAQQKLVESLEGTTAFAVLRFANASLEVSGHVSGVKDMVEAPKGGGEEGKLPASTIALLSASGLGAALDQGLTDENLAASSGGLGGLSPYGSSSTVTRDDIEDWFDEVFGLDFPDDLEALFGTKVELVVDADLDIEAFGDANSSVGGIGEVAETGAGLVITTDDTSATVDAWESVIDSLEDQAGDTLGLDIEEDGNRVIISGGDYLETLLDPDERLADSEAFRRAVPNAGDASAMLYIDVAELIDILSDATGGGDAYEFADGLQALGVTTTTLSKDSYAFSIRLTTTAD
jgi:hypothetical protein